MDRIYLAAPYTHWFWGVRLWRTIRVTKLAAKLMQLGNMVFSPLTHSAPISWWIREPTKSSLSFWMHQDLPILRACSVCMVVKLPGWESSKGIQRELKFARANGLQLWFYDPKTTVVSMYSVSVCGQLSKEPQKIALKDLKF